MATKSDRDEYLNRERVLIKDLILSRIDDDRYREIYEIYLRQTMDVTNELVKEYFDSEDGKEFAASATPEEKRPVDKAMNSDFFIKCQNYMLLFDMQKELKRDYDLDIDIAYRRKKIKFVVDYNITKRLLEIIDWYFGTVGDTTHNKEQFAEMVALDSERTFALRNELSGRPLDFSFDKDELDIQDFRKFLITSMKSRLYTDYANVNIEMGVAMDEAKGEKESTSGALLFHLLNTAVFISVAKEYGYNAEDLDLNGLADSVRSGLMFYPNAKGFVEAMSEVDHLPENAESLANRFLAQKLK